MSHFVEKCSCGIQLGTCRCPSKDKEVRISKKPCTHLKSEITTGEFPTCLNCKKQFIAVEGTKFCMKCAEEIKTMPEPKRYTAETLPPETPDRFNGYKTREVTGYYVKHINATPYAMMDPYSYDKFIEEHTEHYIMTDGFSDWGMSRDSEPHRIDIKTLREAK